MTTLMRLFVTCTASLTFGATPSNATTFFTLIDPVLLQLANTSNFGATMVDESGLFVHTFSFTLSGDQSANSSVTTTLLGDNDIDFSSIDLDGFGFLPTRTDAEGAENWELAAINLGGGLHEITFRGSVVGNSGDGSYVGVLNIGPVVAIPEPASWAMMLIGFSAVGFALRRRRRTELTFRQAT